MLRICPKIDDVYAGVDVISEYIEDMIEIQMTTDINVVKNCIEKVMLEFPYVKEITIHSPMVYCDIEKNFEERIRLNFMIILIDVCNKLSSKYNVRINMLYHCANSFNYFQNKNLLWIFRRLIKMMKGNRTYLLLENVVDICLTRKGKEPCISTVKMLRTNKVKMCLDISHAYSVSTIYDRDLLPIYSDNELAKAVHQVHFSKYKKLEDDCTTNDHCENHSNLEEMDVDIQLLKDLNILSSNLVVEVIELEGYDLRKRELAEIKLLKEYEKGMS